MQTLIINIVPTISKSSKSHPNHTLFATAASPHLTPKKPSAKMQFTLALYTALAASVAAAAPTSPSFHQITVSISNDITGAHASATVPSDGMARNLTTLFSGSAIDQHGAIIGTSAQLTQFTDGTRCFFQNVNTIINLNGRELSFVDLDGNRSKALPVYLNGFNLQCPE